MTATACGAFLTAVVVAGVSPILGQQEKFDLLVVIKRTDLGHLSVGAPADVTVLRLHRGTFGFIDVRGGRKDGIQKLEAELTVREGRVVWDLNGISNVNWRDLPGGRTP